MMPGTYDSRARMRREIWSKDKCLSWTDGAFIEAVRRLALDGGLPRSMRPPKPFGTFPDVPEK
jgi:hypothetical protein